MAGIECYEYCPHSDDGGCVVCEKLENKALATNCCDCEYFINFDGPNSDDRHSSCTVYGFCNKDKGLIAFPYKKCIICKEKE